MSNCLFLSELGELCGAEASENDSLCAFHGLLSRNRPKWDQMASIICEQVGVEPSEVTPTVKITDDLGVDSLGRVELTMEFQKSLGLELPPEVDSPTRYRSKERSRRDTASQRVDNASDWDGVLSRWDDTLEHGTVAEVFELLVGLATGKAPAGDGSVVLTRDGELASRETRQTQAITSSPLFVHIFKAFMLNAAEVAQGINDNLSGARIEQITLVQEYDNKRVLTRVHVFLLSERRLFYWRLKQEEVLLFSEDIRDVNIDATYVFEANTLKSIHTSVKVSGRPNDPTRNFELEFPDPLDRHGVAKFLRKYNRFRSALR
jgi:acyl carrier protein